MKYFDKASPIEIKKVLGYNDKQQTDITNTVVSFFYRQLKKGRIGECNMFWLGMLVGGMVGGSLAIFLHCLLIVGKEADSREYFDEHSIK